MRLPGAGGYGGNGRVGRLSCERVRRTEAVEECSEDWLGDAG